MSFSFLQQTSFPFPSKKFLANGGFSASHLPTMGGENFSPAVERPCGGPHLRQLGSSPSHLTAPESQDWDGGV